ncbi:hypothetical protein [Candidatus Poriferisodalis sp.]|uniref:hypothetical protein n=1 Tax=Candidatus Poriferisodalis sp. TaxID=3101277 RepID=UPI003B02E424
MATRIQYLLEKGTAAALDAVIETINNEAADKLNQWNGIDWENLHTDGDSQEKLLKALNPLLENSSFDPVTLNDLRDLADVWTSLNDDVRTGGAAAGCWAVTFAALATTKGKIAKKPKVLAELLVTVGCAIGERRIPDGSNDDSPGDENTADDSPGDDDGDSPGDENTDGDSPGDDVADENPAGNYCGPWTASAWSPGRGGVTLFVNGAGYSQYQSSYDNREWAAAQCQAALASLGQ